MTLLIMIIIIIHRINNSDNDTLSAFTVPSDLRKYFLTAPIDYYRFNTLNS